MRHKILEQLKKIEGIKTVELAGNNMAVVVFEEKKEKSVSVTIDGAENFKQQIYYIVNKYLDIVQMPTYFGPEFPDYKSFSTFEEAQKYVDKQKGDLLIKEAEERGFLKYEHKWKDGPVKPVCSSLDYIELIYGQYIIASSNFDVIWTSKLGWAEIVKPEKPKSLRLEDLVDGEIYANITETLGLRITRVKGNSGNKVLRLYSEYIVRSGDFLSQVDGYCFDFIRPATLEEKQKLVRAEVEHGFFFNLK